MTMRPVLLEYDLGDGVRAFSTTRSGGCGKGAYGEFNANMFCGDDKKNVDIEVPAIDVQLGGADWADSVNQLIQATVNAEVAQSEARAEEYYDAFIATGGTPEEYHPIGIDVDYEVYYASDEVISFAVIKTETLASAWAWEKHLRGIK